MTAPHTVTVRLEVDDARAWAAVESRSASGLASRADRLGTACRAALSAPCEQKGPQGFLCTEAEEHEGPHEARGEFGEWFESWPADPSPLPGEPRPSLIEQLRNLADNCLIAGPGDLADAADALDAQAQRVAVLESENERLRAAVDLLTWRIESAAEEIHKGCDWDALSILQRPAPALAEAREAVPPTPERTDG